MSKWQQKSVMKNAHGLGIVLVVNGSSAKKKPNNACSGRRESRRFSRLFLAGVSLQCAAAKASRWPAGPPTIPANNPTGLSYFRGKNSRKLRLRFRSPPTRAPTASAPAFSTACDSAHEPSQGTIKSHPPQSADDASRAEPHIDNHLYKCYNQNER